jgi:Rrf2 family protein
MISQTAKYALQILGYLVFHAPAMVKGEDIAKSTGIPVNYLSKILNQLRKNGFVHSQKGWGGGFRLEPAALSRPIMDIVTLFDGLNGCRAESCAFGLSHCDEDNPCPLHPYWGRIRETYVDMLNSTPVENLKVVERA